MTPRESLRSIAEVSSILLEAGRMVVADTVAFIDQKLASAINSKEDEL